MSFVTEVRLFGVRLQCRRGRVLRPRFCKKQMAEEAFLLERDSLCQDIVNDSVNLYNVMLLQDSRRTVLVQSASSFLFRYTGYMIKKKKKKASLTSFLVSAFKL